MSGVALVTGGARGLGVEVCHQLADADFTAWCSAPSEADARDVAGEVGVAIVHNDDQLQIAIALVEAVQGAAEVRRVRFPDGDRPGQAPPAVVTDALRWADVVLAPTSHSISHTAARREATERGARIATIDQRRKAGQPRRTGRSARDRSFVSNRVSNEWISASSRRKQPLAQSSGEPDGLAHVAGSLH